MLLKHLMQLVLFNLAAAQEFTDYCALLDEDDIQGKKHGFLAGNKVYYVGGTSLVWRNAENETLGLTHPFFHDLRSRGTGIAYHEGVGTGNDFYGWEFHRETRVAYGSILSEETRWETPAPSQMFWRPDRMVVQYELSKDGETAANIKEEKFISSNDVVSSTITSDRPLKLEVTGQSFGMEKRIVSMNGRCSFDPELNSVFVLEGGRVTTKVSNDPIVEKEGALVYDGMTGVLSSSRPLENVTLYEVRPGVCGYSFTIQLDSKGTTLSWTMHDDQNSAFEAVQEVLADPSGYMEAKTRTMNNLLNNVVPYFRCSDDDIVKIYYYLWSLHLMYYTQGDQGMQMFPHTQTAVNNFLGLHRYSHKNLLSDISLDTWTGTMPCSRYSLALGLLLLSMTYMPMAMSLLGVNCCRSRMTLVSCLTISALIGFPVFMADLLLPILSAPGRSSNTRATPPSLPCPMGSTKSCSGTG